MAEVADPIEHLIGLLSRLPGLGRRSARRAVLRMLMRPEQQMLPLAEALQKAAEAVRPCGICGNLDARDPCAICRDPTRERELVCVVEGVAELWALERAHAHRGLYHVLGGTLSALGGTGPEDLSIQPLLARLRRRQGRRGDPGAARDRGRGHHRPLPHRPATPDRRARHAVGAGRADRRRARRAG